MSKVNTIEESRSGFWAKFGAVAELTKARLNLSVVYSALAGYFLGAAQPTFSVLMYLSFGGFLVVGAANAFNQILEKDRDAAMQRTEKRPLPSGRLSVMEAMIAATVMALAGLWMLFLINPLTFGFGAFSLFLYVLVYTPLKSMGSIAVFVGAFPGAIPALLGWVAATNDFDIEPGTLFAIQFLWQFVHFWAIAWILDDDYRKAGYSLLPSGKKDWKTAFQIVLYSLFLLPVSLLPYFGMTGTLTLSAVGAIVVGLMGLGFVWFAIQLLRKRDKATARGLMIYSIVYLPIVQLTLVLDKFIG